MRTPWTTTHPSTPRPARAGRDAVVQATTGVGATGFDYLVLAAWTVALAALAVWTYRRDEGRRFR